MRALVIGFGSIGKMHVEILNTLKNIKSVDLVTKQSIGNYLTFKSISDIPDLDTYNYFVIASETNKHYEQLKYICSKVTNKIILVEKPLFDKNYQVNECKNKIYTAYNLRFHPVVCKLKQLLKDECVYYVNIICGQYLPTWRPDQDYRKSYSADKNQGGGVLRDLSHELDYASWLFGDIKYIKAISTKISDLDISSDDIFTAIAYVGSNSIINITMDYISKLPMRRIIIHTKEKTIEADMIKNSIIINDKSFNIETIEFETIDRNYTYSTMHESLLNHDNENICTFQEGKKILDLIEQIESRG